MTKGRRVAAWLLLAAALGLAILGQFYFFQRREYLWDGLVLHGLAALCFLLAWRLSKPGQRAVSPRQPSGLRAWLQARRTPAILLASGLFLSLVATILSRERLPDQSTGDAVVLWGLAILAVGLATVWPASWPPAWRRGWMRRWRGIRRETWLEMATVAGLTVLALVLRVTALGRVPNTLGGDEAWLGLLARQVWRGELQNPFGVGYMSLPTLFYWPLSWSLWLVGNGMAGLRLPAALVGTATVPFLYLLARDLWGRRTALLGAFFLTTYDYHIHYSRLGANNVWDPLFVVLTLWALDRGLTREQARTRSFLAAGMAMGLGTYFYTSARLLPVLVAVYMAFVWFQKRKELRSPALYLGLLVLAFLIVAGPMLGYALAHPDEWNARINQVGILQSGWLEREPGLTGKSTATILGEQFLRAAGAFHVFPDSTAWYGAERPLLGFMAGAFAVLGMAWAVAHWRDRRYFLVLLWFWSVIISGGMLTVSPPSSQRLVIAIPAVALLVAFGLLESVRMICRLLRYGRRWENLALGLMIALLAVSSVRFYFVEYAPSGRYGSENGETATMVGHYLHDQDRGTEVYWFGAPRIYWNFGSMTFLAPQVIGRDVVDPLTSLPNFSGEAASAAAGQGVLFVFLPERVVELYWVQQAFPDGQVEQFYDTSDRLRFTVYALP
jgi:4-amino-4-deoxy-L-arabinose transferase-like glycosyltransferase